MTRRNDETDDAFEATRKAAQDATDETARGARAPADQASDYDSTAPDYLENSAPATGTSLRDRADAANQGRN
jgi:hypothetical protein